MLAFRGWRFQYFLAVSLKEGVKCAQIVLWILEAFMSLSPLVQWLVSRSPDAPLGRRLGDVPIAVERDWMTAPGW